MQPTVVSINADAEIVKQELFFPILYVMKIKDIDEAIAHNNNVP